MTRKECYAILELKDGANLTEVKRAYRKLAFSLHPDLNPDIPDAAKKFQRLNEAYVQLSQNSPENTKSQSAKADPASAKAQEEAKKAYSKAKETFEQKKEQRTQQENTQSNYQGRRKEDVLKDILADPFARRVFQDIYSHLKSEQKNAKQEPTSRPTTPFKRQPKIIKRKPENNTGLMTKLSSWMRHQIDEEQTLQLPKDSLTPGARIRLEIRHGLGGKTQTIELTIPPNFNPNKAIRLKGMGKRLGNWRGDLFVRINPI